MASEGNPHLTVVTGAQVLPGQKFYPYSSRAQAVQLKEDLADPKRAKDFSWNISRPALPGEITSLLQSYVGVVKPQWWCVVYNEDPLFVDGHPEWGEVSL